MDKFVTRTPKTPSRLSVVSPVLSEDKLWQLPNTDINTIIASTLQFPITGIRYIPAIINFGEAKELMDFIDASPWSSALARRVQHYGYVYDYRAKNVNQYLGDFPVPIQHLCNRVSNDLGISDSKGPFDQAIINEYLPGQGIAPHTDHTRLFGDTIVSVSVCGDTVMDMANGEDTLAVPLKSRSLICLQKDGRYVYTHSIAPRKSDNGIPRNRRVSVTFRRVVK